MPGGPPSIPWSGFQPTRLCEPAAHGPDGRHHRGTVAEHQLASCVVDREWRRRVGFVAESVELGHIERSFDLGERFGGDRLEVDDLVSGDGALGDDGEGNADGDENECGHADNGGGDAPSHGATRR